MGGVLTRVPLRPQSVEGSGLIADYASILLMQVRAAFDYWQSSSLDVRATLPANLYEDMFGLAGVAKTFRTPARNPFSASRNLYPFI